MDLEVKWPRTLSEDSSWIQWFPTSHHLHLLFALPFAGINRPWSGARCLWTSLTAVPLFSKININFCRLPFSAHQAWSGNMYTPWCLARGFMSLLWRYSPCCTKWKSGWRPKQQGESRGTQSQATAHGPNHRRWKTVPGYYVPAYGVFAANFPLGHMCTFN